MTIVGRENLVAPECLVVGIVGEGNFVGNVDAVACCAVLVGILLVVDRLKIYVASVLIVVAYVLLTLKYELSILVECTLCPTVCRVLA